MIERKKKEKKFNTAYKLFIQIQIHDQWDYAVLWDVNGWYIEKITFVYCNNIYVCDGYHDAKIYAH